MEERLEEVENAVDRGVVAQFAGDDVADEEVQSTSIAVGERVVQLDQQRTQRRLSTHSTDEDGDGDEAKRRRTNGDLNTSTRLKALNRRISSLLFSFHSVIHSSHSIEDRRER